MERLLVGWGGGLGQPSQVSERGELNAGQACRTRRSTTAKSGKGKEGREDRKVAMDDGCRARRYRACR